MKKRIKKKQSRLVKQWMAEHPEYKNIIAPKHNFDISVHQESIEEYCASMQFPEIQVSNELNFFEKLPEYMAECFVSQVAKHLKVTELERSGVYAPDHIRWFGATLKLVKE